MARRVQWTIFWEEQRSIDTTTFSTALRSKNGLYFGGRIIIRKRYSFSMKFGISRREAICGARVSFGRHIMKLHFDISALKDRRPTKAAPGHGQRVRTSVAPGQSHPCRVKTDDRVQRRLDAASRGSEHSFSDLNRKRVCKHPPNTTAKYGRLQGRRLEISPHPPRPLALINPAGRLLLFVVSLGVAKRGKMSGAITKQYF